MNAKDLQANAIACESPFGFRSSKKISYKEGGFSSEEERVRDSLAEDLKSKFEDVATKRLKGMTKKKQRLGLEVWE